MKSYYNTKLTCVERYVPMIKQAEDDLHSYVRWESRSTQTTSGGKLGHCHHGNKVGELEPLEPADKYSRTQE